MRWQYVFLLCSLWCTAQQVDFEGFVLDSKTNAPIPYVNISFLNTLKGTSTDEDGHFLLELSKDFLEKKIHVSSLGYRDTVLMASQVFKAKKLKMKAAAFELDEVVVIEDLGDSKVLNPISSYQVTSGFDSSSTPWILALYFPNIGATKKYLEKVTVFFQRNANFKQDRARFRIRFFEVVEGKVPGNDLVNKSLVLEHHQVKEYISLDVASMNLKIPEEGIYVGLEWLFIPSNWYKRTEVGPITKKNRVEDRFAPTFGGIYSPNANYKTMVYGMGEWRDFKVRSKNNQESFIPAITLRISTEKKS